MGKINFSDGLTEYSLNDAVTVHFNPSDTDFISRIYDAFEALDAKQEAYKAEAEKLIGKKELFDFMRERDKEMRAILDGLFDRPVCEALFGSMNVYAKGDGLPVWANLMLALVDEIDANTEKDDKLGNSRLQKYIKKYQKK